MTISFNFVNAMVCRPVPFTVAPPPCFEMSPLILKRASLNRPSGQWEDDDYDVLADGMVVGRIFKPEVFPGLPWMWTPIFPYHEGRTPTHGYAATREAAMAAFAKSWRRA
jgi:hypothetical protein